MLEFNQNRGLWGPINSLGLGYVQTAALNARLRFFYSDPWHISDLSVNHDPIAQKNNNKTSYTTHCVHGSRNGCYWSQRWWFHFEVVVQWKRDNEKKDEEKASKVFNNGLLWSNGCHLYTEGCVDAKLEPEAWGGGLWREWLHRNSLYPKFQDVKVETASVTTSTQDSHGETLIRGDPSIWGSALLLACSLWQQAQVRCCDRQRVVPLCEPFFNYFHHRCLSCLLCWVKKLLLPPVQSCDDCCTTVMQKLDELQHDYETSCIPLRTTYESGPSLIWKKSDFMWFVLFRLS